MVGDLPKLQRAAISRKSPSEFSALWKRLNGQDPKLARLALKARCRTDRVLFAKHFFGSKLEHPFSRFHLAGLRAPKVPYRERPPMSGWRRARMGPRGNGKSEVFVKIETIHDIVYEFEEFIVVVAESADLARDRVREIASELEENRVLRSYFGDDLKGSPWRSRAGDIETWNGVRILAKSMSGQVRGIKHPVTGARPTKFLLDDAEDSVDVLNPELRARDRRIFHEDIEGAAGVEGRTNIQFTGTPLHREALLPSVNGTPGWDFQSFPAIEQWPERMDLWEQCRQVYVAAGFLDSDEEDGTPTVPETAAQMAERFYRAHRKQMDRGAKVLWPDGESLLNLFEYLWRSGEASFWKEKLLVPRDPSLSTFDMEAAVRHTLHGDHIMVHQRDGKDRKVLLSDMQIVGFHDPSGADPTRKKSASKLGDYACIVTMGVENPKAEERRGKQAHVLGAWLSNTAGSAQQIEQAFALGELWRYERFILEADVMGLLKPAYRQVQAERKSKKLFHQLPIYSKDSESRNKPARIASLEPAVSNGWLTFGTALPKEFLFQFADHPTADHDDGPDATEGAWRFARSGRKGLSVVSLGGD